MESIKEQCVTRFGDQDGRHSGIIAASDLSDLLSAECPTMSESDKQRISRFAIKGSRRAGGSETGVDLDMGLVHIYHMEEVLSEVISEMRKDSSAEQESFGEDDATVARFRREMKE